MRPTTRTIPLGSHGGEVSIHEPLEDTTMSAMNWLAAQLTWERRLAELRSGDSAATDTRRHSDDEATAEREAA